MSSTATITTSSLLTTNHVVVVNNNSHVVTTTNSMEEPQQQQQQPSQTATMLGQPPHEDNNDDQVQLYPQMTTNKKDNNETSPTTKAKRMVKFGATNEISTSSTTATTKKKPSAKAAATAATIVNRFCKFEQDTTASTSTNTTATSATTPYHWPSLYEEMDDMFDACCLIYAMAELRKKARNGQVADEIQQAKILQLPMTAIEIMDLVEHNQSYLHDVKFGKHFYLDLLQVLAKRQESIATSTRLIGNYVNKRYHAHLVALNDALDQQEMVYGIAVNPNRKRITICFRGSISKMDWAMDRQIYMTTVDNPVQEAEEELDDGVPLPKINPPNQLHLHCGFYTYLCAPLSQVRKQAQQVNKKRKDNQPKKQPQQQPQQQNVVKNRAADGGDNMAMNGATIQEVVDNHNNNNTPDDLSQYQEILQRHILPLVKQYPGYKIYATGHSLGAALATLFAFFLAAEPNDDRGIPKPVTCVSFGSPYVGGDSFRRSHQVLERQGQLRHMRVTNHQDLVTLIPFFSFRWKVWDRNAHVGSLFKHAGMNIKLFEESTSCSCSTMTRPFRIIYPKVNTTFVTSLYDKGQRCWESSVPGNWSWDLITLLSFRIHGHMDYQKRLDDNMKLLQDVYLNDLYSDPNIVGNLWCNHTTKKKKKNEKMKKMMMITNNEKNKTDDNNNNDKKKDEKNQNKNDDDDNDYGNDGFERSDDDNDNEQQDTTTANDNTLGCVPDCVVKLCSSGVEISNNNHHAYSNNNNDT